MATNNLPPVLSPGPTWLPADAKAIFLAALECEGAEALSRFLEQACGDDAALRQRVEELLQADRDAGDFLVDEVGCRFAQERADRKIKTLLRRCEIEFALTPAAEVLARVQGRSEAVQTQILAALDFCRVFADDQKPAWWLGVMESADPDPWRSQVRKACMAGYRQPIDKLARQVDVNKALPRAITLPGTKGR